MRSPNGTVVCSLTVLREKMWYWSPKVAAMVLYGR